MSQTSMVSLPLMARLLEALRPDARLLLVGDPDQLASVEAGAVLGDLVARPPVTDGLPAALRAVLPADVPDGEPAPAAEPQAPPDMERLRNGASTSTGTGRRSAGSPLPCGRAGRTRR